MSEALTGVKHEQEYMEVRERIHRASEWTFYLWHMIDSCFSLTNQDAIVFPLKLWNLFCLINSKWQYQQSCGLVVLLRISCACCHDARPSVLPQALLWSAESCLGLINSCWKLWCHGLVWCYFSILTNRKSLSLQLVKNWSGETEFFKIWYFFSSSANKTVC